MQEKWSTTKMKEESQKHTNNIPPRLDTVQTETQQLRRGERQRQKPEFFGENVTVTQVDGPLSSTAEKEK